MSLTTTESEVITNQPSSRRSSMLRIAPGGTQPPDIAAVPPNEPTLPRNEEMSSQNPFTFSSIGDHQKIEYMDASNDAEDAQNKAKNQENLATNSPNRLAEVAQTPKEVMIVPKKSYRPELNKDSRSNNINGPDLHPGAGSTLGLSLGLIQLCDLCTRCCLDCCDEYYKWCCCCCNDSEICVHWCTGCMECCADCDCSCCN